MLIRLLVLCSVVLMAAPLSAEEAPALKTQKEKTSYSIGMDIGTNLKRQELDLDAGALATGLKDALSGGKTQLTSEQAREILTEFQQELRAKTEARTAKLAEDNKKTGEAFLAGNKKKKGVVTLPSGLQYKVLTEGKGPKPKATDTVSTHYRGTLIDGTEFDSSYERNEPATFPVNGVIPGWVEALQLMPVGSKWQLVIPSDLAYGPRGAGQAIGPNATLVFEVELLSIQAGDKPPAP